MPTLGFLHPGAMGASVGAAAAHHARVLWATDGRSAATRARAERAGLHPVVDLPSLVAESEVILGVCPPHAAVDLARAVAACGFAGIYVDANAVSPATARKVAGVVTAGGARFVDGGIIGPPAWKPGSTRLYLSSEDALSVVALFTDTPLRAVAIDGGAGAASALKMAYAAYTKGSAALVLAIRALAGVEGVEEALLAEWRLSQPGLDARSDRLARQNAPKAWRFVGEMEEIASSFQAAGLPGGFHEAAAEIYRRLADFKDTEAPEPAAVLATLRSHD